MSKRAGTVVTLEDLVDAIGVDAARYALARYTADSTIDLDLDLWTKAVQRQPGLLRAVRPRPAVRDPAQRRRPRHGAGRTPTTFDPSLLSHEQEGELLRALAEFPRVVAGRGRAARAAPGGALPRGHRRDVPPVLRRRAGCCRMGDEEPAPTCTGPGCCSSTPPAPCSPTASACSASPPPSGCDMRAHEAGWAHADGAPAGPPGCGSPRDANALVAAAVVARPPARTSTACSRSAASTLPRPGRRARLAGVRPRRGRLPGPGPRLPRRRSPATTSSTPARRSSARRSPAGSPRRGSASTSAPAASWPSRCGPASTRPGSASTATTRPSPSCAARSRPASAGSSSTRSHEIERLAARGRASSAAPPG